MWFYILVIDKGNILKLFFLLKELQVLRQDLARLGSHLLTWSYNVNTHVFYNQIHRI